nr:hypothetical protein [Halopenitus persicus]
MTRAVLGQTTWGVDAAIPILVVILLASIGTGVLFLVSVVAYRRRRRSQYGLIAVAIGALWVRSVVGAGTVFGHVPMPVHHFISHSLDLLTAGIVLYAVYMYAPGSVPSSEDR